MSGRRRGAVCTLVLCLPLFLLLLLTSACTALPSLEGRPSSTADLDTGATRLGRAIAPLALAHPGRSGIHPFPTGAMPLPRAPCWPRRRKRPSMSSTTSGTTT